MKYLIVISIALLSCKKQKQTTSEPTPAPINKYKTVNIYIKGYGTNGICTVNWDYSGNIPTADKYSFSFSNKTITKSINTNSIQVNAECSDYNGGPLTKIDYTVQIDGLVCASGTTNNINSIFKIN